MDGLRKYGPIVMLMIMSLSFACLAANAYCGTNEAISQCQSVSDSLVVDDIDLDQYDYHVVTVKHHSHIADYVKAYANMSIPFDLSKAKISHDLKIGLVRRYSPGDCSFSWVNYAWTFHILNRDNGIDCNAVIPLFFCPCFTNDMMKELLLRCLFVSLAS
jgi:hypothetical protein